jgi:hypothetical protein
MNNIIKNLNFTKFLDDNVLIAQTISLILFFESYSLMIDNRSIVNMTINLNEITVLPFIFLLAAIALSKVTWFLVVCLVPVKRALNENEISTRTSYTSFILTVSTILYLLISYFEEQTLFQVSHTDSPLLFSFIGTMLLGVLISGGYVFLSHPPKLGNWK